MVKILDLLALLAYCALIYWLSDQSSVKNPFDFGIDYQDKLYHAGAYFIMGILIWRVLHYQIASSIVLILLSISFLRYMVYLMNGINPLFMDVNLILLIGWQIL